MDKLLYTLFREPEHEMVLCRGTAGEMLRLLGKTSNPYFWYEKISRGKYEGWSVIREDRLAVEKSKQIFPPEAVVSPRCYWPCGGRKERMCGECPLWEKDKRRVDGRRYGLCKKRMERTDRCTWCLEWKDKSEEKQNDGNASSNDLS